MSTGAAITELLRAGYSDKAVARQLHVHRRKVRAARTELGLPAHKPGPSPSSAEDLFWRRAVPTDDGHLLWTGPARQLRSGPNRMAVGRIAFRIRHGRNPIGKVTVGCGTTSCVHPDHVEDQPMRQQYTAIFGRQTA